MNKKANFPLLPIIFGIIFLVIVLMTFGIGPKKYVSDFFEGIKNYVTRDTAFIAGTQKGKLAIPHEDLSGDPNEVAIKIASKLLKCYDEMRKGKKEAHKCETIKITSMTSASYCNGKNYDDGECLTRSDVITFMRFADENKYGNKDSLIRKLAIHSLEDNWGDGYKGTRWKMLQVGTMYLICADVDGDPDDEGPNDDDNLWITADLDYKCK